MVDHFGIQDIDNTPNTGNGHRVDGTILLMVGSLSLENFVAGQEDQLVGVSEEGEAHGTGEICASTDTVCSPAVLKREVDQVGAEDLGDIGSCQELLQDLDDGRGGHTGGCYC